MGRPLARMAYLLVAWLFVGCALVQVFLAGMGVFAGPANFITHKEFGYLFGLLTLVLIVLALVGRMPRRLVLESALLLVLFALQSVLLLFRASAPVVAALHPVNGFLILLVGVHLALSARSLPATAETARA